MRSRPFGQLKKAGHHSYQHSKRTAMCLGVPILQMPTPKREQADILLAISTRFAVLIANEKAVSALYFSYFVISFEMQR